MGERSRKADQLSAWFREVASPWLNSQYASLSDSRAFLGLHQSRLPSGLQLNIGTIVTATPHAHWYRVQLAGGHSYMVCTKVATGGSLEPYGVKEAGPLGVGNLVLVAYSPTGPSRGHILGIVPKISDVEQLIYSDLMQPGSNAGANREEAYTGMLTGNKEAGGVRNYGCGRASDVGAGGEWGWQASSGVRIRLDESQAVLAAGESCGLWANTLDDYLRLVGHNLDIMTAGSESILRDDEGEWLAEFGESPYLWEALGLYDQRAFPAEMTSVDDLETFLRFGLAKLQDPAIQAFWRLRAYRGYVGQGVHGLIVAPPIGSSGVRLATDSEPDVGLLEVHADMTGRLTVRAARGVGLYKDVCIAVPRRKAKLENKVAGDNPENYRAAGVYGSGPDHDIQMPVDPDGTQKSWKHAAAQPDLFASQVNDVNLKGFAKHEQDFTTPEADETAIGQASRPINFSDLADGTIEPEEVETPIKVDDRFKDLKYFLGRAQIDILPDGSIVIGNPMGANIRLSDGDLFLNAPRIWIQSGENVNLWAGKDLNVRARGSVDVSTTEHDIRLRAFKNIQIMAQQGGVLIESQSDSSTQDFQNPGEEVQSSGVLLRSKTGPVLAWAGQVYLRTGSDDGSIRNGPIIIDAAKGRADIITHSSTFQRFAELGQGYIDGFMNGGEVDSANAFTGQSNVLFGGLSVQGFVSVGDSLLVEGNIAVVGGHIATEQAEAASGFVASLKDDSLRQATEAIRKIGEQIQQAVDIINQAYDAELTNNVYQGPNGIGSDEFIKVATFSFRDDSGKQYGSENFRIPETRYQQMLGNGEATGGRSWEEQPVRWNNQDLYPFPGREAFEGETLLTYRYTMFEGSTGNPKARPYDSAELGSWEKKSLNSDYLVIAR
jgi:hypothetical protein